MTNNYTEQLLNVVQVREVVWIDDDFAVDHTHIADSIIAAAKDRNSVIGTLQSSFPYLGSLDGGRADKDAIADALRLESAANLASLQDMLVGAEAFQANRLNQLAATFRGVLGKIQLQTIDFNEWDLRKKELLAKSKTMFLVDWENVKGGTNGLDVLKDILVENADGSRLSVILTNCQVEGEIEKGGSIKGELAAKANIDGMISVMAKARLSSDEDALAVDAAFSKPLHRICLRRITGQVAEKCAEALKLGMTSALEAMTDIPISDVEEAVFARTWSEGGSELDVISRIFAVSSRSSLTKSLVAMLKQPSSNFFRQLETLRQLTSREEISHSHEKIDERLKAWRTAELFDDGELVNQLHSPLECGDIFQKENGGQFVLVCAPCDLMVRGTDAGRQASEGVFLPIRTTAGDAEPKKEEEENQSRGVARKYFLPSIGDDEVQEVRFNDAFSVNLRVLDWCVWNSDGKVKVNFGTKPRLPGVLQVGWKTRLGDAHDKCTAALEGQHKSIPPEYATLCLFPDGFLEVRDLSNGVAKSKQMDFKLKRVRRLRAPYSDALLAAYLADAGRHGFDHDFARRNKGRVEQTSQFETQT